MVEENVISLRIAVERHLKAKSRLPVRMVFRGDVFRFLFKGRGVLREGWLFLAKGDFLPKYFPPGWDTGTGNQSILSHESQNIPFLVTQKIFSGG